MLLCDEHVERGDDEEGEDGADGHSTHQDEADRVAGGGAGSCYEDEGKVPKHGCQAAHEDRAVVATGLAAPWCGSTLRKTLGRAASPSGA